MFKLKKVFAILSLEEKFIKLIVLENNEERTNCLFCKKVAVNYCYDFSNLVNVSEIVGSLINLTKDADEFLGINIKKYIVNIAHINVKSNDSMSPVFQLNNKVCSIDSMHEFVGKIESLHNETNEQFLCSDITKWYIDGQEFDKFPEDENGNELKFEYITYSCDKVAYSVVNKVLSEAHIVPLAILSNKIILDSIKEDKDNDATVDILDAKTIIHHGMKEVEIESGYSHICDTIKAMLGIDGRNSIKPLINIVNLTQSTNENVPVINRFSEKYLDVVEVTKDNVKSAINIVMSKFINGIVKANTDVNKLIINFNDDMFELNRTTRFDKFPNVNVVSNDIILMKNENISLLVDCFNLIKNKQLQYTNHVEYSIDAYIDNTIINDQFRKNILVKLGIMSTSWAAKLGE